jgi:AcrR family transcriptional regulator
MMADIEAIAVRLFAELGYENVSYDHIAKEAGTSVRTVYRYFPTKGDFLLAMPRRELRLVEEALQRAGHSSHPMDDVIEVMIALSNEYHDTLDLVVLWHKAVRGAPEIESRSRGEQALGLERLLVEFCATALDLDDDDVAAHAVAVTIAAFNQSVARFWLERGGQGDLEELYRRALVGLHRSFRHGSRDLS